MRASGKIKEYVWDMLLPAGRVTQSYAKFRTAAWVRLAFILPVLYGYTLYSILCKGQAFVNGPMYPVAVAVWVTIACLYAVINIVTLVVRSPRLGAALSLCSIVLELTSNEVIVYLTGAVSSHALIFIMIAIAVYRVFFDYWQGMFSAAAGCGLHALVMGLLLSGVLPTQPVYRVLAQGAPLSDLAGISATSVAIGALITFSTINLSMNRIDRMQKVISDSWKKDLDSIEQFNGQVSRCADESSVAQETIRAVLYATPFGRAAVLEVACGALVERYASGWGSPVTEAVPGLVADTLPKENQLLTLHKTGDGGSAFCIPIPCGEGNPAFLLVGSGEERAPGEHQQSMLVNIAQNAGRALGMLRRLQNEREKAILDGLTGLYNKRYLLEQGPDWLNRARADGKSICLALFDIDHFKQYNDAYGHGDGDELLRLAARTIAEAIRAGDAAIRFGGEEFVILFHDMGIDEGALAAERIRLAVQGITGGMRAVTVSGGIASCPADAGNLEELLERADKGLYEAKRLGRNRVCRI